MNFETMTDTELLLAHCRIIDHIRQRNLHSPGGNPIAGYAELLVSERLRLELAPDENVGFDARDLATGETYQIKHTRAPRRVPQTGMINNLDGRPFDLLVFLILNQDLSVREAWKLAYDFFYRNARYSKANDAHYICITQDLRAQPELKDISYRFA